MPDEDICPRCGNDVRMRSPQKSQGNSFSSNPGGRAGKSAQQNDWSSIGDNSNAIFNVFPPANDFSSGKGTEEKASQSGTMKGGSAPVGPTQNYASRSDRKQGTSSRKREKPGASHSGSKAGNPQKTSPGTAPDRAIFDVFPPAFGGEAPETGVRGEPSFKAGPQVSQAPGQPPQGQGGAPFVAGPQEEKPFNADPQGGMPFSNTPQGGWTPGQTQQGSFGAGPQDSQPSQGQGGTPFGAGPQDSQPSQGQGGTASPHRVRGERLSAQVPRKKSPSMQIHRAECPLTPPLKTDGRRVRLLREDRPSARIPGGEQGPIPSGRMILIRTIRRAV